MIDLRYPDEIDRNDFYQDQSGSWFTPSQWEIAQCLQTTGGISVITINPKLGLYVIKPTDNK